MGTSQHLFIDTQVLLCLAANSQMFTASETREQFEQYAHYTITNLLRVVSKYLDNQQQAKDDSEAHHILVGHCSIARVSSLHHNLPLSSTFATASICLIQALIFNPVVCHQSCYYTMK